MTARLILIAHAETVATRKAAFADGESLNARGRTTARRHGSTLPKSRATYASPAPAACQTASLAGLAATVEEALRDLDVGRWRGHGLEDVVAGEPQALAAWMAEPEFVGHGGESIAALIHRTARWLAERCPETGTIIVVAHAAVLRAALTSVLDAPSTAFWRIDVRPLSMIHFSSDGRRWVLREMQR